MHIRHEERVMQTADSGAKESARTVEGVDPPEDERAGKRFREVVQLLPDVLDSVLGRDRAENPATGHRGMIYKMRPAKGTGHPYKVYIPLSPRKP